MMPTVQKAIRLVLLAAMLVQSMLGAAYAQAQQPENGRALSPTLSIGIGPASASNGTSIVEQQREVLVQIRRDADRLENRLRADMADDARLVDIRNALEDLARRLLAAGVAFRPRLSAINNRLDEIGPPPGENQPAEPAALTEERASLQNEKGEINTLLGEAEALSLRVNRLIEEVAQIRRDLFANTLSRRYDISVALSSEVLADFATENRKLYQAVSSWLRFVVNFKLTAVLFATFLALAAALILLVGGRRLFGGLIVADPRVENPSYLSRLSVAFWSTLMPSAALAVFLVATFFFYSYYNVLRIDIAQMMVSLFNVVVVVFFVYRLSRAVFAPGLPNWRLIPIETGAARILFWLFLLTAVATGLDFFMSKVNDVMGSPLSLTVAKSLVATLVVGLLVVLIGFVRPFVDADGRPKGWHPAIRFLFVALGGGTIVAALLGYIGLARFISQQIVVTGAIVTTMIIGHMSATAISDLGAFTRTALGRRLDRRFNFDEATEDQLGLVFSIVINVLVIAIGVPLILLQWGFQLGDLQLWLYNVATEIRIGSFSISLFGILSGIAIFLFGFFATRLFQSWLDGKVMARGRVDTGVRNSINLVVGYTGLAIAALIGISAAGLDLSNLALVAGALSVGIGFGLQNIVNNFVSGLILLAERPFKVGDWIVAGPVTGTVRKISVRATEIETFQRQTVILPNSELINAAVGNWTHRNKLGRIELRVGVGYDSDPRQVHQLLLEIAKSHPLVLKNPEPFVAFFNFGESSLDFEIRVFMADITTQGGIANDLRFQILERFRAEGIEIPFPQRDLNIRQPAGSLVPLRPVAAEETEPQPEPPRRRRPARGAAG